MRSSLKLDVIGQEETVLGMARSNAGVRGEYKITKSKIVGMIDGGNRLGGGGESFDNDESASALLTKQTPYQYVHKQDTGTNVSIAHKSKDDGENLLGGGVESSEDDESSDESFSDEYFF